MAPQGLDGDPPITPDVLRAHKIGAEEFARVQAGLGREPTFTELGVFSVMWSEHCSYKSSRIHLKRLPTSGPKVIQGPGENAGVVDIGDGFAAVFKMESHNHPSFLEPFQGAATGVGGILRDVFTMGARPIASMNLLRFGDPEHPKTAGLLRGVVAGIAGYGNAIGVPTVGGELGFDRAYNGNILVNAFTCGVVRKDRIFYGRASGVGNPIFYVGARTGRDGIHGATMASDEFKAGGPSQRPTVQVGDPFMEKLLLEACLEIFAQDLLIGIQDMGAAGLTSSSVEMAGRSGSGVELDLDAVPRRAAGMKPYEMLLSESQERMLLVAKPGCERAIQDVCAKWQLECCQIGRVTDSGRWVILATPGYDPLAERPIARKPVVVCDLPVGILTDDAPIYERPQAPDRDRERRRALPAIRGGKAFDCNAALLTLLASPNIGSRQWVWRQYDHIVRGGSCMRPGGDAAVVRVPCETEDGTTLHKWLAFSADCPSRVCDLDPFLGGALAVVEACRNLVCVGAEPLGLTDCLNFGSPERPEVMSTFAASIDGMASACRALSVPIVSGNVSLYNETNQVAILPTPAIGAVGMLADPGDMTPSVWQTPGNAVLLVGAPHGGSLGGSEFARRETDALQGTPPPLDLQLEKRLQDWLLGEARRRPKRIRMAHDVSDGGIAVAAAEACDSRQPCGAHLTLPAGEEPVNALFGEAPSRVLIEVEARDVDALLASASTAGVFAERIGAVTTAGLVLSAHDGAVLSQLDLEQISRARAGCLGSIIGND